MESDGTAGPEYDDVDDTDDEDYDVVEAWTGEGTGLAFDGRVLEYFSDDGSLRLHIRIVDVTVEDLPGGSTRISLKAGGTARAEFDVGADERAAFLEMIGIVHSTRELIDTDAGLDHW